MLLRILISGAVALPIALTGAAHARDAAGAPAAEQHDGISFSLPRLRLPGAGPSDEGGVQVAQVADPRITQLEEQVRNLTGTLEELNFQILQMQDQIRRMQEDNELRFQQLEERRSGDAGGAAQPAEPRDAAQAQPAAPAQGSGDDEYYATLPRVGEDTQVLGAPPRTFGTITFDENGNATGAGVAPPPQGGADQTTVAALPSGGGEADELYRSSYELILSGDYSAAESGFRQLIANHPSGEHAADAHFWLGEALLAQQKPREAAEVFLAASRDFPDSRKAPDTLLKLGISLAAMDQRDVACATFVEVLERYPDANDALRERVKQEQALASC